MGEGSGSPGPHCDDLIELLADSERTPRQREIPSLRGPFFDPYYCSASLRLIFKCMNGARSQKKCGLNIKTCTTHKGAADVTGMGIVRY